jgi:general secretion pathway protein H
MNTPGTIPVEMSEHMWTRVIHRRSGRAFTLIELLVVMVVISIVAGSVVVCLQGRQDAHGLRAAGKDLAAALRFAGAEARLRQMAHRIAFSVDLDGYRIEAQDAATLTFEPIKGVGGEMKHWGPDIRVAAVTANGSRLDPPPDSLEFSRDGHGFAGDIQLQGRNAQTIKIEVTGGANQVNICE